LHILQTFGIPTEVIPVLDEHGKVSLSDEFRNVLEERRQAEQDYLKGFEQESYRRKKNNKQDDNNGGDHNNNNNNTQEQEPSSTKGTLPPINDDDTTHTATVTTATGSTIPPSVAFLTDPHKTIIPSRFDVLLGRGKGFFNHVGNIRYRGMIEELQELYDQTSSNIGKKQITSQVVKKVHASGGTFLKGGGTNGGGWWIHVDDETARLKVSHSFRALRKTTVNSKSNNNNHNTHNLTARQKEGAANRNIGGMHSFGGGGGGGGGGGDHHVIEDSAAAPTTKRMRRD
jgi:hypothetical protein